MKKIYSLVAAIVLGTGLTATAQHVHDYKCGHAKAHAKILQEHPEIQQIQEMQDAYIADYLRNNPGLDRDDSTVIYTIPVVFHIVHNFGPENIPNANILDQVYILNRDYQKLNADTADVVPAFRSAVAKCGFQFKLATIDPLGNCTNGIDRVVSPLTTIGSDIAKSSQVHERLDHQQHGRRCCWICVLSLCYCGCRFKLERWNHHPIQLYWVIIPS